MTVDKQTQEECMSANFNSLAYIHKLASVKNIGSVVQA